MADVANRAGVSHQTVSRVLNEPNMVRESTRARVEAAMKELGYRRNLAARTLASRKSNYVGIFSTGEGLFGPTRMVHAVERAARSFGYISTHVPAAGPEALNQALDHLYSIQVAGIIAVAPTIEAVEELLSDDPRIPIVLIAAGATPRPDVSVVAVDQGGGARLATSYLADLGHTTIAHISGPPNWFDSQIRMEGWQDEVRSRGLPEVTAVAGSWEAQDGYDAAHAIFDANESVSAIFAANDLLALGATRAIHDRGGSVPQDVSVVGFDDIDGTEFFRPALTTVRQPFTEVGVRAIEVLIDMLQGGPSRTELVEPNLIIRESSSAPTQTPRYRGQNRAAHPRENRALAAESGDGAVDGTEPER